MQNKIQNLKSTDLKVYSQIINESTLKVARTLAT